MNYNYALDAISHSGTCADGHSKSFVILMIVYFVINGGFPK